METGFHQGSICEMLTSILQCFEEQHFYEMLKEKKRTHSLETENHCDNCFPPRDSECILNATRKSCSEETCFNCFAQLIFENVKLKIEKLVKINLKANTCKNWVF